MEERLLKDKFMIMVESNQNILHKISRLYSNDEGEKRDLFQEILYQVWRSFPKFRGECKESTWIYRVALNTATTHIGKEKKNKQGRVDFEVADGIAESKSGVVEINALYSAISRLESDEKAMMMLYLDEHSYEEIAEIIGISKANVAVRIHRVKGKLGLILKNMGYGY